MGVERASSATTLGVAGALDLLDWKQRVFRLYDEVRSASDPRPAWQHWVSERDRLYREHPQSPIPAAGRPWFGGCMYFEYDPEFRVVGDVLDAEPTVSELAVSTGGTFRFTRIGRVRFLLRGEPHELELEWNEGYGGGLFLAFRDASSNQTTYGGGRYLFDTVKGSDLGFDRNRREIVLDFNFAYNPSCSYDPRWGCPLASQANLLPIGIAAGEKHRPVADAGRT